MSDDATFDRVRDEDGLAAARRWCRWHLGDASWADNILDAYFNPETAEEAIDKAQARYAR